MLAWLLAVALAAPAPRGVADVREQVASGVVVDWTTLSVEATTTARGTGLATTRKAVELEARRQMPASIEAGGRRVRVDADRTVDDLLEDEALTAPMSARLDRWVVTQATYYASGRVELVGELPIVDLLKPWTMQRADTPPVDVAEPKFTGVIVDARGSGFRPAFAPPITAPDGQVLYDGKLWADAAVEKGPVIYVHDVAHPAAVRAGERPLVLAASASKGSTLVLDAEDAIRFRSGVMGAKVLGEGTIVVVVDP